MILLALLFLFAHPFGKMEGRSQAIKVQELKQGHERVIMAENLDPYGPRHLMLDFTARDNVRTSTPLPLQGVLKPGEKRELLRVSADDPGKGYSYRMSLEEGFGDPAAVPDESVIYLMPWEHGKKHPVGQGYFGVYTHQGMRALDFDMPLGTKICAARDGVVVALRQDLSKGGPGPEFALLANYIDILHADGTWATYAHLEKNGAVVKLGQHVKAGQVIGLSGATGQVSGPHLHFCVQRASLGPVPDTVATRFMISASESALLEEGKFYYAWHPGGPAFARVSAESLDEGALAAQSKPAKGGKLSFHEDKLDNKDLIYCANGTSQNQQVTVDLARVENAEASQPLPYTKLVPARTELFLMSVTMKSGHSSYQSRFSAHAVP